MNAAAATAGPPLHQISEVSSHRQKQRAQPRSPLTCFSRRRGKFQRLRSVKPPLKPEAASPPSSIVALLPPQPDASAPLRRGKELHCQCPTFIAAAPLWSSEKGIKKGKAQRVRSSGRRKWMIFTNMARFLSVSVTELTVKAPKAIIEVKDLKLDVSKNKWWIQSSS
ncbi:hypothetical protein J5N97_014747 [Dioscorea zingiberensis]|uniref:Uncharacterized protein n=1 Tax=Dioscorea zingiberensis TaxID=325984 RepID=A0A9D5CU12_9LILI|nr:hypothetical protein J5N97_014747 [Dioscorea zingiberensis]